MEQRKLFYYDLVIPGELQKTEEFLSLQQKIRRAKPSLLIAIETHPKIDYQLGQILESLAGEVPILNFPYGLEGDQAWTVNNLRAVRDRIQEEQTVFVLAPMEIKYFLLINGPLRGQDLPGVSWDGQLLSNACWVLHQDLKPGMLTEFLKDIIGYAQPYPDALGKGKRILQSFFASVDGIDYPYIADFAEERVDRAMQLAIHRTRCAGTIRGGEMAISVDARGFGIFHTGTLIACLKKLYPEAIAVAITSGQQEKVFSLALFDHFHRLAAEGDIRRTWNRMKKQKGAQNPSDYLVRVPAKEHPGFPF